MDVRRSVQCIVKRPDGTFIRPVFPMRSIDDISSPQKVLHNALKHYDKIEESELLVAWLEQKSVRTETTYRKLTFKKP